MTLCFFKKNKYGIKEKENDELVFFPCFLTLNTLHIYIIYKDMSCFPKNRMANQGTHVTYIILFYALLTSRILTRDFFRNATITCIQTQVNNKLDTAIGSHETAG